MSEMCTRPWILTVITQRVNHYLATVSKRNLCGVNSSILFPEACKSVLPLARGNVDVE